MWRYKKLLYAFLVLIVLSAIIVPLCVYYIPNWSNAYIYIVEPGPKYPPTKGEVWPKPQNVDKLTDYFEYLSAEFSMEATNNTCSILNNAITRYTSILKTLEKTKKRNYPQNTSAKDDGHFKGPIKQLQIVLDAPCEKYPHYDMDEEYRLIIESSSRLTSASIWGILRGMETFVQSFYISTKNSTAAAIYVNATKIEDYPAYKHRGLLLDTGRHFVTMPNILRTLDAMEMNKMNVFHWHIVDDQSFPMQSERFPELSLKGAFHPSMVYTKDDIKVVIDYARDRAIRVIPEIDVPGHVRSWGAAFPDVLTKCYKNGKVVALGPLNPINNATYELLEKILNEVQDYFPDNYLHVGGDEVDLECWRSNPEIKSYMSKNGMTAAQLHRHFMKKIIPMLAGRSVPVVWQEVFDENVTISKETLVQVWKYKWIKEMDSILKANHRVIFSSSWYLDYLSFDWDAFYRDDPRQMVYGVDRQAALQRVVGGEACMWGERADDTVLMSRTWPRTSAIAERLWSGLDFINHPVKDLVTAEVRKRIEEHTCRMRRRGVAAEPPNGPGFCLL